MNQRILKKLAKKAIPVVRALNKAKLSNIAIGEPDYDGVPIGLSGKFDRKHFDRNQSLNGKSDFYSDNPLVIRARKQNRRFPFIRLSSPSESWSHVPFHTWRCCWEVPEYDAEDLWSALLKEVENNFHQPVFSEDGDADWGSLPNTSNPSRVFKLAEKMIKGAAA